jgi:hypothetical protein
MPKLVCPEPAVRLDSIELSMHSLSAWEGLLEDLPGYLVCVGNVEACASTAGLEVFEVLLLKARPAPPGE